MKAFWIALLFSSLFADSNRFFWDAWSSHQPVLHAIATSTTGPIIEFGCGYGSTDLLHEICEKEGRMLISLDDDLDWLNKFAVKYADDSEWHQFYFVPGKKGADPENPAHWVDFMDQFALLSFLHFDVCFIDQSPWLARHETVKRMKDKARFVVIHDVDYFPRNNIFGKTIKPMVDGKGEFDFHDLFTAFHVYFPDRPGPPTLIGSNFEKTFPIVDFSKPIAIE